jgi:predicted ester cyclase
MTADVGQDLVAANKALVAAYFEAIWNEGQLDAEGRFVDEGVVVHGPLFPGMPDGAAGQSAIVQMLRAALPDLHLVNKAILGEGDVVIQRWSALGTHTGALLFGVPASGSQLTLTGINEFRIAGGMIVERWGVLDTVGLMQQLGIAPG